MNNNLKYYRETPLGEQLGAHLEHRTQLRQNIPLLSLFAVSWAGRRKPFEAEAGHDERLQRA